MRFTVDVTAGLAFGQDINTLGADTEVIQVHLDKIFPAFLRRLLAPVPYWRYLRLPADRELIDIFKHSTVLSRSSFVRRGARLERDPRFARPSEQPDRGHDRCSRRRWKRSWRTGTWQVTS